MGEKNFKLGMMLFKDPNTGLWHPLTDVSDVPTLEVEPQGEGKGADDIKFYCPDESETFEIMASYIDGRQMIAEKRRKKRKARKFGGRWVEHKLHYNKNGRDNLYYEWRVRT